eukprot:3230527-Prymnesium_polylepis.3
MLAEARLLPRLLEYAPPVSIGEHGAAALTKVDADLHVDLAARQRLEALEELLVLRLRPMARVGDAQVDVDAELYRHLHHLRAHVRAEAVAEAKDMLAPLIDLDLPARRDELAHPAARHLSDKAAALVRVEGGDARHPLFIHEAGPRRVLHSSERHPAALMRDHCRKRPAVERRAASDGDLVGAHLGDDLAHVKLVDTDRRLRLSGRPVVGESRLPAHLVPREDVARLVNDEEDIVWLVRVEVGVTASSGRVQREARSALRSARLMPCNSVITTSSVSSEMRGMVLPSGGAGTGTAPR